MSHIDEEIEAIEKADLQMENFMLKKKLEVITMDIKKLKETITSDNTVQADIRKPVIQFAEAMEETLKKKDYKGGWDNCFIDGELFQWLEGEVKELEQAIIDNDGEKIKHECTDVANYAMMIFDKLR